MAGTGCPQAGHLCAYCRLPLWVNQSWLPQLAIYGLYTFAGFPALALSIAALATVTSLFVRWNG